MSCFRSILQTVMDYLCSGSQTFKRFLKYRVFISSSISNPRPQNGLPFIWVVNKYFCAIIGKGYRVLMRSEKSKYTFIGRLLMQHRGKGLKLIRLNASWKQDLKWILHSWCNNLTFWEIHVLSNTCQDWHHSALNDDGVMAATSSGDTLTDNIFLNRLESESESFETFVPKGNRIHLFLSKITK